MTVASTPLCGFGLTADSFEVVSPERTSGRAKEFAYKCGEADESVTRDVTLDRLSLIEPPVSGGAILIETASGASDADLCSGRGLTGAATLPHRFLQFEVYGPAHYWVLGLGFAPQYRFEFDFIRSMEDRGEEGLLLHMQKRQKGDGWDAASTRGQLYDLTIIPHGGDRIEIPELAATFVRCKPSDPIGAGMHRW